MNTPPAKHYQEMEAALGALLALKAQPSQTPDQIAACADRIQRAWSDVRDDYHALMEQVAWIEVDFPGSLRNWIQIEDHEAVDLPTLPEDTGEGR